MGRELVFCTGEEAPRRVQGTPKQTPALKLLSTHQPHPAPGEVGRDKEKVSLFSMASSCHRQDPRVALGFSLLRRCGPGGCQPPDGQGQLSAALPLRTGMYH